jgi:hypothetical protein
MLLWGNSMPVHMLPVLLLLLLLLLLPGILAIGLCRTAHASCAGQQSGSKRHSVLLVLPHAQRPPRGWQDCNQGSDAVWAVHAQQCSG